MRKITTAGGTSTTAWKRHDLADLERVYLWADGIYVKAGLEREKAALLVVIGAPSDGEKVILAVESGHRAGMRVKRSYQNLGSTLLRDVRGIDPSRQSPRSDRTLRVSDYNRPPFP